MRKPGHKTKQSGLLAHLASAGLFLAVLAVVVTATLRLDEGRGREGLEATETAVRRAAVLCYATEGFYPPSLAYMEQHYGVLIDHDSYTVRYEVLAPNLMPQIYVVEKG